MWELEDFTPPVPTSEDSICENYFVENVSRNSFGRYEVALPFKADPTQLGDSFALSQTRLFSLEKRLEKNLELRNTYYLQHNQFSFIPKFISKTLEMLDFRHNSIREITNDNFDNLPALQEIILENNKLQFVDANIFLKLPKLERLYLYTNLWECSCKSVRLFRDLAKIVRTESELECDIGKDERIIADAGGITQEFVNMCPAEKKLEHLIEANNGVLKGSSSSLLRCWRGYFFGSPVIFVGYQVFVPDWPFGFHPSGFRLFSSSYVEVFPQHSGCPVILLSPADCTALGTTSATS
ncbi:hypothetical protein NQ314_011699 [Rhamnusium bicolor]|uniref:Uncharacterized protein n=1 Tax=Rhamnusium bicolor TaxID=1586634 RepID=A0AAV8XFU6_9CUCU|nr:hypothetical protein NQ314_011699 [Rhamnusium bicolor]